MVFLHNFIYESHVTRSVIKVCKEVCKKDLMTKENVNYLQKRQRGRVKGLNCAFRHKQYLKKKKRKILLSYYDKKWTNKEFILSRYNLNIQSGER